jgi:hypothetical protein
MRYAVSLLVVLAASSASADKSDKLLQKAKKLHAEKKYTEACPAYEEVDKTDPAIGNKLNVAKCYEDWGKLATAYLWYTQADKMALDAKDEREPKLKEQIEELDTNVPRITLKIPEGADPDVVDTLTLDGQPIAADWLDKEQRIDPGPHVIEFTVEGQKKKKMAPIERGGESELSLDIPKGTGKKPRPKKKKDGNVLPPPPADPGKTRRYLGLGVGGAGVVMVGVASVLTLTARSNYKSALRDHCMGATNGCDGEGYTLTHDARSRANIGTVFTIVGVAAIGGGAFLYFTAPKAAEKSQPVVYVTPTVDRDGGGVVIGGTF